MSRIGNAPIKLPNGVLVELSGPLVKVSGPKGSLEFLLRPEVSAEVKDGQLTVKRVSDEKLSKSLHGLTRAKIFNMIQGVTEGWKKELEMVGVGYRAQGGGDNLNLSVGYSHPISIKAPEGVNFSISENTKIMVSGIDKELVGQVAANVRAVKKPEPYKGKGIRYVGEYVRRKAGKAGKAAVGKT